MPDHEEPKEKLMAIITISRGSMSGGMAFAECLAKTLGYPSLAREILIQAAGKLGVSEEKLRGKIEKSARFWERMTSDRRIYLIALQSARIESSRHREAPAKPKSRLLVADHTQIEATCKPARSATHDVHIGVTHLRVRNQRVTTQ